MPITITDNGIVLVLRQTDDGNWRTSINPGDTDRAGEILDADELAQVTEVWTPEVIAAWEQSIILPEPNEGPTLPTIDERMAAVESAVLELMLGGLI